MWERIYNFGRILFNLSEDLKDNRANTVTIGARSARPDNSGSSIGV